MLWHRLAYRAPRADDVPRPYVYLSLIGPTRAVPVFALVDSGSDQSIFRSSIIGLLGFNDGDLATGEARGLGGAAAIGRLRSGSLTAQLLDIPAEVLELRAAFSQDIPFNVLGRSDFFRTFDVAFYEADQEFHLRDRRV